MDRLDAFLSSINVAEHHIEHYNHMVSFELPNMIDNFMAVFETKEHSIEITFANTHISRASRIDKAQTRLLFPSECRRKELSYMSYVYASVLQKKTNLETGEVKVCVLNKVIISQLPTMISSCLCNLSVRKDIKSKEECDKDLGGYFLINGNERVLVTQETKAYNMTQVLDVKGFIAASMRSMSDETGHSVVVQCAVHRSRPISEAYITLPYVSKKVPMSIFFFAIGYDDPRVIYQEVGLDNEDVKRGIDYNFTEFKMTQENALFYIGALRSKEEKHNEELPDDEEEPDVEDPASDDDELVAIDEDQQQNQEADEHRRKTIAYARQVVQTEIFPHLGVCATTPMIFEMVCYMLKKMFACRVGLTKPTERDNLMYKRFENSGSLIFNLYRICLKHFFGTLKQNYSGNNLNDTINKLCTFTTKTIHSNFAKGVWGIQKNAYVRYGVSQILTRLSYVGTLSHMQRVSIPIGKEGKNVKIRMIHPSHYGYICLYETPEGRTCGIVINMTISCKITRKYSTNLIRDLIKKFMNVSSGGGTEIWVNSTLKMYTAGAPTSFISEFCRLREDEIIPKYVNIYHDKRLNVINISSDGGRITRPLYDRAGNVVWLDSAENQHSQIAMYTDEPAAFQYVEIHPCLTFGVAAGCIPFSDHNQSPRNVYESNMIKQALGIFARNFAQRYDTTSELMPTVQRSICSTSIARAIGCPEMPAGINCIVAIMTCGSWNAEDSLVFNREAIQRGLFHSITFKTLSSEEYKKESNSIKRFCLPPENVRNKLYNYSLLGENGIVKKGSHVKKKDVIVGKIVEEKDGIKDCSDLSDEEGVVERIDLFRNINGYMSVKIILKVFKIPERGDKFANMCAQKGTIGMILPQVDMPFTEDGIVPDVIINPNALPSRMTVSMFLEMILGKYGCLSGEFIDATPFSENSTNVADRISNLLVKYGFERNGTEFMINGETGVPFRSRIFIGTSYYQKLKHMVSDKIHARPFGEVTMLTRQPPAGRSKDGGLRVGEMERDCLLAHGTSSFLTSRIFDRSDAFHIPICNNCHIMSNHKDECHLCRNTDLISTRLPFASKLLFQQLTACLIGSKFSAELL